MPIFASASNPANWRKFSTVCDDGSAGGDRRPVGRPQQPEHPIGCGRALARSPSKRPSSCARNSPRSFQTMRPTKTASPGCWPIVLFLRSAIRPRRSRRQRTSPPWSPAFHFLIGLIPIAMMIKHLMPASICPHKSLRCYSRPRILESLKLLWEN